MPEPIPTKAINKPQEMIKKDAPKILASSFLFFNQFSIPKVFWIAILLVVQYQK